MLTRRDVLWGGAWAALAWPGLVSTAAQTPNSIPAQTVSMGPRPLRHIENTWIPMPDGVRLAARMWLPADADRDPVPAIFQLHPYRKRDHTRQEDEEQLPFLASHGYACVRVDIRGAGDSDGHCLDEYVQQELDDAVDIIAWLARQPWCTGKVGMFGISWSGFNALQVAALRPPALAAIVSVGSTDDRYDNDNHYIGGCLFEEMFVWGSIFQTRMLRPPDPAIVGDRWLDQWKARLETMPFFIGEWMSHPHRDAFWRHGSICEDYASIQCPAYLVCGGADAYVAAVPRMLEHLQVPRKGLIGPWAHQYPYEANPGPGMDWLNETRRWWDHWLKGIDTGLMDEPMYRVFMQAETLFPFQGRYDIPGRWVAEPVVPSPHITPRTLFLNDAGLGDQPARQILRTVYPVQTLGSGDVLLKNLPGDMHLDLPGDQRLDDALSLCLDSAPVEAPFDILGAPVLSLDLSVDRPVAFVIARLCMVMPNGISRLVAYGVLNLCHRDSHANPTPLEPGRFYQVRLPLRDAAQTFPQGVKIRIALSTTYWPLIWPSPDPVVLTVRTGSSSLTLPVRPRRPDDDQLRTYDPPFVLKAHGTTPLEPSPPARHVFERENGERTLRITGHQGPFRYRLNETGTEVSGGSQQTMEIDADDPTSARMTIASTTGFARAGWNTRGESVLRLTCSKDYFFLNCEVKVFNDERPVFSRVWDRALPRQLN